MACNTGNGIPISNIVINTQVGSQTNSALFFSSIRIIAPERHKATLLSKNSCVIQAMTVMHSGHGYEQSRMVMHWP